MRLICPNCDAQYEVDARAIPVDGRDVQCSNCGHTWFHQPDDDSDEVYGEPGYSEETQEPEAAFPEAKPVSSAHAGQTVAPGNGWPDTETAGTGDDAADTPRDDDIEDEWDGEDDEPYAPAVSRPGPGSASQSAVPATGLAAGGTEAAATAALTAAAPRRRELDESVAQVLREEAERETRARQAERGTLESQADLGLDTAPTKKRHETSTGVRHDPFADDNGAVPQHARRRILPDIEQINSSLNASNAHMENMRDETTAPEPEDGRRGFRLGFGVSLLVGLILLALYAFTPQIIARIPVAEPVLTAFGGAVDGLRGSLDQMMKNVILSINGAK